MHKGKENMRIDELQRFLDTYKIGEIDLGQSSKSCRGANK